MEVEGEMRELVRSMFCALTQACDSRRHAHTLISLDEDDVSIEWNVAVPSPCTVLSTPQARFEFHSKMCNRILLRYGPLSGLLNHDLTKNGWGGDHGVVFDPQNVIAASFQILFIVFEQLMIDQKMSEIHENACSCACVTLAMKFTRRSALCAIPTYVIDCDPQCVKLGNVFRTLFDRFGYNEQTLHTLVEQFEGLLLQSQLSVFGCCTSNAAALAELSLYDRCKGDTARFSILRDVASFLFVGLHVGGSDVLEMTKSVDLNVILGSALSTAAMAIVATSRQQLGNPGDAELAARVIGSVLTSHLCSSIVTQAQRAEKIGALFQHLNLKRAISILKV